MPRLLLAFLAPASAPRPAQWTYRWTDWAGFLGQGLGRAPRKGPVPWASPHTPTGLLAGHPWPPASSLACLWVTPGARPDAVKRPRGPSACSAFVSDDGVVQGAVRSRSESRTGCQASGGGSWRWAGHADTPLPGR